MPVSTHSLHWVVDKNFRLAIDEFLQSERSAIDDENEILTNYGPFKKNFLEKNDE